MAREVPIFWRGTSPFEWPGSSVENQQGLNLGPISET